MTYPDKYYCKVGQREGEGCFSHKKADVPCYISRPTEKKIVMWYMITVSLCSIALGEDFEDPVSPDQRPTVTAPTQGPRRTLRYR